MSQYSEKNASLRDAIIVLLNFLRQWGWIIGHLAEWQYQLLASK